jgi:hypothetical protein
MTTISHGHLRGVSQDTPMPVPAAVTKVRTASLRTVSARTNFPTHRTRGRTR